jgi:PBP1b-binding outer membrane lipoprotein LpoB
MQIANCKLQIANGIRVTVLLALALSGCTSAVQSGHNTLLDSVDLVQMTDQMARSIVADKRVQEAIQKDGSLKVVVQPVENRITAGVLPRGEAQAFTARVRALLSKHDPDRFTWVLNRDEFYDLRNKELEDVPLGPAPEAVSPQYALTAVFSSLSDESSQRRTDFYVCTYELSDLQTRNVIWSDSYKVKKTAVKGFLD